MPQRLSTVSTGPTTTTTIFIIYNNTPSLYFSEDINYEIHLQSTDYDESSQHSF